MAYPAAELPATITLVPLGQPGRRGPWVRPPQRLRQNGDLQRAGPVGNTRLSPSGFVRRVRPHRDRDRRRRPGPQPRTGRGDGTGRHAPITRTLERMVWWGAARWLPDGSYAVRKALAPLTEHRAARLPLSARRFHEQHSRRP